MDNSWVYVVPAARVDRLVEALGGDHGGIVTYPGASHAFFNDTGPRYHPDAAAQAYAKVLGWFGRHLG
jgi:carboxymethylenebutenolidase